MAGITWLPRETLDAILDYTDTKSRSKFSMTCLRLRPIVEERLYETIDFTWHNDKPHPPVAELLYALTTKRHLARYVKTIEFKGWKNRNWTSSFRRNSGRPLSIPVWNQKRHWLQDNLTRVGDLLDELGFSDDDSWLRAYANGEADVVIALILSLASNLSKLILSPQFLCDTTFIVTLLRQTELQGPSIHVLPKLRHIVLSHEWNNAKASYIKRFDLFPKLTVFLRPHSMETLRIAMPGTSPTHLSKGLVEGVSLPKSNISALFLSDCGIKGTELAPLLKALPRLRVLRIALVRNVAESLLIDGQNVVQPLKDFVPDFEAVSGTLEHLQLSLTLVGRPYVQGHSELGRGRTKKVRKLKSLRTLEIPLVFLLGHACREPFSMAELLPKNLKGLCLTDDCLRDSHPPFEMDESILKTLESYFHGPLANRCPLEKFTLQLSNEDKETAEQIWSISVRERLKLSCETAGIQYTFLEHFSQYEADSWHHQLDSRG